MLVTDQGVRPAWSNSICIFLVHPCAISCHGDARLVSAGGPASIRIRSGQVRPARHWPERAQAQNETILYACYTKLNQVALCTTKFDEKFAMLIPKVAIHSSVNPSPQAFVPAVTLKFFPPMTM